MMHLESSPKPSESAELAYKVLEVSDTPFQKEQTALWKEATGEIAEEGPLGSSFEGSYSNLGIFLCLHLWL